MVLIATLGYYTVAFNEFTILISLSIFFFSEYETHTRLVDFFFGVMVGAFMRETKEKPYLGRKMDQKKLFVSI